MRNLSHKVALRRNGKALPKASLPLFEWAESRSRLDCQPLPRAVDVIARRFNLSPSTAALVAERAGFRMEVSHG
ncbi:hypothetical protein MCEMSEM23_00977 [Rhabdaerophilaceae bacterium]